MNFHDHALLKHSLPQNSFKTNIFIIFLDLDATENKIITTLQKYEKNI